MKPGITAIVIFTAGAISTVAWWLAREADRAFVADSVQVISYNIRDLCTNSSVPSDLEVQRTIRALHEASVIRVGYANDGTVTDLWGMPFHLEYERIESSVNVACSSAGPDRRLRTSDDLRHRSDQ